MAEEPLITESKRPLIRGILKSKPSHLTLELIKKIEDKK
jgi:hypothetical protein